jgi:hypothetical protein
VDFKHRLQGLFKEGWSDGIESVELAHRNVKVWTEARYSLYLSDVGPSQKVLR